MIEKYVFAYNDHDKEKFYMARDNRDFNQIQESRNEIKKLINCANLLGLVQIHSDKVIVVDSELELSKEPEADAFVTNKQNLALSISTADCVPLLFNCNNTGIIGAAHAGWRGAKAGIIENTLNKMQELGANIANIEVQICPCISQENYEIDQNFYNEFLLDNESNDKYFIESKKPSHKMFDLRNYVKDKISNLGVKKIDILEEDTYKLDKKYPSFRRATHKNIKLDGNILSVIVNRG